MAWKSREEKCQGARMEDWGHIAWCSAFEFGMCFILQTRLERYSPTLNEKQCKDWLPGELWWKWVYDWVSVFLVNHATGGGSGGNCAEYLSFSVLAKGSHWRVWQRNGSCQQSCSRRLNSEGDELRWIEKDPTYWISLHRQHFFWAQETLTVSLGTRLLNLGKTGYCGTSHCRRSVARPWMEGDLHSLVLRHWDTHLFTSQITRPRLYVS